METSGQGSIVLSEKIGERLQRVARISSSRSCLGPGRVRSWGRIVPVSKSSTRTRARMPWRTWAPPSGPVYSCSIAQIAGSVSLTSAPAPCQATIESAAAA